MKLKIIKQFDESDCGAACLAMILNHYENINKNRTFIFILFKTNRYNLTLTLQ